MNTRMQHRSRLARTAANAKAGFTLAEILVTVLIMGGIMVSVTQILYTARVSRDNIHNIQETQLAGPAIMDMIERDLRGLMVFNRTKQDHLRVKSRVMMGVDGDSIDFVTTTDNLVQRYDNDRFLVTSINEVGYRLRPNPEYDDFLEIYRREDASIDEDPFEGGEFTFLHDRVKSFDIQVFSEDGVDAEPIDEWGGSDDENIGVPARLEITLVLELQRRIEREALRKAPTYLTEVTYKRVIRLPEALRADEPEIALPRIPALPTEGEAAAGGGGAGGGVGGGSSGGANNSRDSNSGTTGGSGGASASGGIKPGGS